jgi:hypothetical protein
MRKIIKAIDENHPYAAKIMGYRYEISFHVNQVHVVPRSKGSTAVSSTAKDNPIRGHGGRIFNAAQQLAWDIKEELDKFDAKEKDEK